MMASTTVLIVIDIIYYVNSLQWNMHLSYVRTLPDCEYKNMNLFASYIQTYTVCCMHVCTKYKTD